MATKKKAAKPIVDKEAEAALDAAREKRDQEQAADIDAAAKE